MSKTDLGPAEAIVAFCRECAGRRITPKHESWYHRPDNPDAVKACKHEDCALWPARMGGTDEAATDKRG